MQASTKMMVERRVSNGSIINISSIVAKVKAYIALL
jgi:NAD(P)-dependent dehydrogenase (short-subunit alcohol dehydrogenase family)